MQFRKPALILIRLFRFTSLLLPFAIVSFDNSPNDIPPDLQELAGRASTATSSRNWDELRKLGATPDTLHWLDHRARPGDDRWQFHLMEIPGDLATTQRPDNPASRYLGVFSAYHSCQSIGDHFHRMEKRGSVWKI